MEVVAIRELVHWVTALVARVSCFFSFFGHTVPFLGIFIVYAFYFFNSTVIIFCFYMLYSFTVFLYLAKVFLSLRLQTASNAD